MLTARDIYGKMLIFYEISVKIKVRLPWTFIIILITSALTCKQRLLHGNKIVQYFQNYKCYGID